MPKDDASILVAWAANAEPWTSAVREQRIASRRRVTDAAIVDAVMALAPRSVLDVGCGEGWLCRRLASLGVESVGIDGVPALVERARELGSDAECIAYEALGTSSPPRLFDVAVCNFSLIGDAQVDAVLAAMPRWLSANGRVLIQTLHPVVACGDQPYQDGWREGSWVGCGEGFADPAPWYFRTLEGWIGLFARHGLVVEAMREPPDPATAHPASVIFQLKVS